ncbi:MAG: hypothetical protein JSW66_17275 [Phycisphaerales bacterium]|nr:MAG: hypothetical protein JSW66_17275 [Phycisphaerales bacterium]
MADKLVTIAKFPSYTEADLAKQLLDDFGIKSVVIGEKLGLPYPIPSEAKLQAFEREAERAQEIPESNERQE